MKVLQHLAAIACLTPWVGLLGCGEFEPDLAQGPVIVSPDAGSGSTPDAGDEVDEVDEGDGDGGATVDATTPPGPFANIGVVGPSMTGLRVSGHQILNAQGQNVVLHGVNRSGTEYKCVQHGGAVFDGPSDEESIQAIVSWKANAVRIPLNESCWLGINGAAPAVSGAAYQSAILGYVALLHKYNIVPIVELHWVGPNSTLATAQQPMPDDSSPAFWTSVATTFGTDDGVIFEPYNEPFPGMNRDTVAAWTCWRDGCTGVTQAGTARDAGVVTYTAVGMQSLVDAIRPAEGTVHHVVLLGGIEYSNDLSMWSQYAATDSANNLGAAWHVYSNNTCNTTACWAGAPQTLSTSVPIVATEIGERDCMTSFVTPLMTWLDTTGIGYLAWSWDAYGACVPQPAPDGGATGSPWSLVTDYVNGIPNGGYATAIHDHFAGL